MFIPYGNSMEFQYSMEYFSGIQVESTTFYFMESMDSIVFHMDSILFHIIPHGLYSIPHYSTWIPHYSTWIPHGFHIIPYGFYIIPHCSTFFHIESQAISKIAYGTINQILYFVQSTWVRSHDFPKPVKIFKSMTFKIITQ